MDYIEQMVNHLKEKLSDPNNPELKKWIEERPESIKKLISKIPPWHVYRVQNGHFPATIYSYDEHGDDVPTIKAEIHDPFLPRKVFGLKEEDFTIWL